MALLMLASKARHEQGSAVTGALGLGKVLVYSSTGGMAAL